MRPSNHAKYVQLMNIGIKKADQKDEAEMERIRVHPDAISAVMLHMPMFIPIGSIDIDMPGRDEPPKQMNPDFFSQLIADRTDQLTGRVVTLDRKRLVEILQGMTSSEVTIHITKSDAPVLIVGGYDREADVSVLAAICPRIPPEE